MKTTFRGQIRAFLSNFPRVGTKNILKNIYEFSFLKIEASRRETGLKAPLANKKMGYIFLKQRRCGAHLSSVLVTDLMVLDMANFCEIDGFSRNWTEKSENSPANF